MVVETLSLLSNRASSLYHVTRVLHSERKEHSNLTSLPVRDSLKDFRRTRNLEPDAVIFLIMCTYLFLNVEK